MRFFFFLLLLVGVALGALYPWYINNFSGQELGSWTVYDTSGGFRPVEVRLSSRDEPVRVLVDLTTRGAPNFSGEIAVLTLTASTGGQTVLADTMNFSKSVQRDQSPQRSESIFRGEAGLISPVQDGTYTFTIGQGDAEGIDFSKVDLILRGGAGALDPRAQPVGIILMVVGIIGIILASRRRKAAEGSSPSQPAPPRWGRGGGA